MIGTLVNVAAVILGSLLGLLLRKGLSQQLRTTLTTGMGLCVVLIGLKGALGTSNEMIVILSMVAGGCLGYG